MPLESDPMPATDLLSLATAGVQTLQPYQAGKPLAELEREYGIHNAVKLASNENPLGPSPRVIEQLSTLLPELARYPDGNGFGLKQALADRHAIPANRITLGNGSNDILELVSRGFVTPDHEVIFSEHAFAVYPILTRAVGARAVVTPASNYGHDLRAMAAAITARTRLIFIANPNNPTGSYLDAASLQAFLEQVPANVLVVLDEAYYEYARDPALGAVDYPDGSQWLDQFPNLIVTRTFSKAWGLAGLRIGYSLSHPQVADILNRVRQPFNVNSLALAAAETALQDTAHLQAGLAANARGMQAYIKGFTEMGLDYLPSVGNFICVRVGEGLRVYDALLHEGVIVRPVANYGLPEYLRISIGTPEENARCITALRKVLSA